MELAEPLGLAAVCNITGVRQAGQQFAGIPVHQEATLDRIVQALCGLTGVQYQEVPQVGNIHAGSHA